MWGIVPAAGQGSRMQPLAFSKELLPVGSRTEADRERPRAVSEYLIERLVILSAGDVIEAHHLPMPFSGLPEGPVPEVGSSEPRTLAAIERAYVLKVLEQTRGNKSEAAKILGITRQTLRKKLAQA